MAETLERERTARATHRVDGAAKVRGEACFAADVRLPGMAYGAVVRSPYPHARIVAVRTSAAAAHPGVLAVITAADLHYGTYGRRVRDIPVLAKDEVRFVGERVAAVAAETEAAARAAAALVEVDYEPLPAVLDPEEALAPGAVPVHAAPWAYPGAVVGPGDPPNLQSRRTWRAGPDVEAALAASAWVFEGTFRTSAVHQGYLEPHACVALWRSSTLEVWASNKSPYALRRQLAECLGLAPEAVVVHPVFVGGDFGGKGSPMDVPVCAALAAAVSRPVKLVMVYGEDLVAANPRHPARTRVRLGLDADGRFTALDVDALFDGGAYAAFKPLADANLAGVAEAGNTYRIPSVRITGRIAYTHTVPKGHMRSPGSVQVNFAVESLIDVAARALGLDPVRLRAQNLLQPGDRGTLGEPWLEVRARETLAALEEALASTSDGAPAAEGASDARGVGVALYARAVHAGPTEVALEPAADGSLTVWVGFPDQGGGQFTVARDVVQAETGLPAEAIRVRQAETGELAPDGGVGGSRVTVVASTALAEACRRLLGRLAELPEGDGRALADRLAAFARRFPGARVTVRLEDPHLPPAISFCAQAARVRVDRASGAVTVEEVVSAVDVAAVVHPAAHRNQIEGAVAMAFGEALLEDLAPSEGTVGAQHLGDYRLPSIRDVPRSTVVLVPGAQGIGPRGVKPIGELANVAVPAAIANAVADAVGVRIPSLPITAEKVYRALHGESDGAPGATVDEARRTKPA